MKVIRECGMIKITHDGYEFLFNEEKEKMYILSPEMGVNIFDDVENEQEFFEITTEFLKQKDNENKREI